MRTRKTGREDIPALKALWQEAFGDEQQDIDLFFETVYPNATGFCAEDGGELVSMLFALPQTIVKEEKQFKCAYLYAVATKKDRQGEGLCSALLAYAEKELRKRYFEALLLSPASERLADFYAERGFTRQTGAKKTLLDCAQPTGQATEIGVQDYAGLRETMLFDVPHVRYPKAMLDYEAARAKLYRLELGYDLGCAAVSVQDGTAVVEELLPDLRMLPALAAEVHAERYLVRTPGHDGLSCMAKWLDKAAFGPVWLAFPFD